MGPEGIRVLHNPAPDATVTSLKGKSLKNQSSDGEGVQNTLEKERLCVVFKKGEIPRRASQPPVFQVNSAS